MVKVALSRHEAAPFTLVNERPNNEAERYIWGISSAGRAPALQAGGRRFDPVILHQWFLDWLMILSV